MHMDGRHIVYRSSFMASEQFWPVQNYVKENNSLLRQQNTKEIIINHKGIRMVKDGED